jgi:hypothetical protein
MYGSARSQLMQVSARVHQHDVAAQLGGAERLGVEPPGRVAERGHAQAFEHGHLAERFERARISSQWPDPPKLHEERRAAHVDGVDGPAAAPRYGLRAKKASWPWRQTPAKQAGTRRSVQ